MKKYFLCTLFMIGLFLPESLYAEPPCHIRHYSTEDGIPQYNIMDIIQDTKGFLWLATWDGLSKFDGYEFKNYKAHQANKYFMKSNRIEKLELDKFGRIWLRSYDDDIHCFNPMTEEFWGIFSVENNTENKITNLFIQPSGRVWLILKEKGCLLLKDSTFNTESYNAEEGKLISNNINFIFEDSKLNNWLLTDNGISCIQKRGKIKNYFEESISNNSSSQAFFCGIEFANKLWFGSVNGRIWQISDTQKHKLIKLPFSSNITSFKKILKNQLIIFSQSDGFAIYSLKNNSIKIFSNNILGKDLSGIQPILIDSYKNMWFQTNELGIFQFNLNSYQIKSFQAITSNIASITSPPNAFVIEDIQRRIWIQPKGGGFALYNPKTEQLEPFYNSITSNNWLFSSSIHSVFSDKQGNLWLSTHTHGLEKVVFDNRLFNATTISSQTYPKSANEVRAIYEDENLNLWVSTKNGKLTILDKNKNKIGELGSDGWIKSSNNMAAPVYCIMEDKNRNIWIGTKGAGIYCMKRTLNPMKFEVTNYKNNPIDVYSLSNNNVYSIFQDNTGNIWIGTFGGGLNLLVFSSKGKGIKFINHRNNLDNFPINSASQVRFVTQNKLGNICLGTTGGMVMFSAKFSSPEDIQFKNYSLERNIENGITNNDIHGICITKKGEMYIFTFGGGIDKVIEVDKQGFPTKFKAYTTVNGLPSDVTLEIIEDEFGMLWVTTENSLIKFDPVNETFKTFAETRKILENNYFSEVSACRLRNNDLVFGYSDGLLSFSPKKIKNNNYVPYIAFTNLQISNKNISVGEKSPLKVIVDDEKNLRLTYKQRFFNIQFAALDFIDPENISYAYQLEGFDKEWNYVQKQRTAYYTNIPKGHYTLKVKSTNSDGDWVDNERTLKITILPSTWESTPAIIIYAILILVLLYFALRLANNFYRLKANVALEKKLSDLKLKFFTDISHEIRTPLTMISGPVDYLLSDEKTSDKVREQLKVVSYNTNRMLRLVNQILDLRKIQSTNLRVKEVHLAEFVSGICDNFKEIAEKQKIEFNFQDNTQNAKVWLDPDSAEKIILNLLSNAFKYTPTEKSIQVTVNEDENNLSVKVSDKGIGISKEKQKRLFTRFESFSDDKSKPSTGIGLNLVKELVEKHTAKIDVESEEGKGSTFTVSFRKGLAHFNKDVEVIAATEENKTKSESSRNIINDNEKIENQERKPTKKRYEKYSILVVEDDEELRKFIKTILQDKYEVYEAEDGQIGLKTAINKCPDFIVSDIMMPNMDGMEMLKAIREEKTTSHIPVILLTAKSTVETKIEGMQYGADDYITKPFSINYFEARIENLLNQRKKLQEYYMSSLAPTDISANTAPQTDKPSVDYQPAEIQIAKQDEVMMKKVMDVIEKNMDNYSFSVGELSKYVGMSRSVFFKKLKSLTGLSPIEFVRDIKMKRAAQLLSTKQLMVKEVASMVGILDTRYFSRCFKAKYGVIPQDFKNKEESEK